MNRYTKSHRPYELIYYEKEYCKDCASKREAFLKSGRGRYLIDIIEKSGLIKN